MNRSSRVLLSAFLLLLFSSAAGAAVFIVPPDGRMIDESCAIVVARVDDVRYVRGADGDPHTLARVFVEEPLKGNIPYDAGVDIDAPGGILDDEILAVSGVPTFHPGSRVLLFLDCEDANVWRTRDMTLGKFEFVEDLDGRVFVIRAEGDGPIVGWTPEGTEHFEIPRFAEAFLAFIRAYLAGENPDSDYFFDATRDRPIVVTRPQQAAPDRPIENLAHYPASAYLMAQIRWNVFDSGGSVVFRTNGTQPGYDSATVAQQATGAWTSEPNSNIRLSIGGTTSAGFADDNQNVIVFNAASGVPSGAIGYAQIRGGGQHTFKGETFYTATEADVIMRSGLGISANAFLEAVTHEIGHGIGFRHSNEGTPATSQAVMNSVVSGSYGNVLQPWDRDAASHVYGSGTTTSPPPTCTPPTITSQPRSQTIAQGQTAVLSVTASGSTPISYQWYIGSPGNTTSPVSGATGSSLTVTPSATTSYWVRVWNACGAANSITATITVSVPSCTRPTITMHPQSRTIASGTATTLTVTATGTAPLTYRWYRGVSGNRATPVGTNSPSYTTGAITGATSFWVEVTNSCGAAQSLTATITVSTTAPPPSCTPPVITQHPRSATITSSQNLTLSVTASGTAPLSYQWFRGTTSSGTPLSGATSSSLNVAPTTTTSYWVRVTNNCGSYDSATATVTVNATAPVPSCPAGRLCLQNGRFQVSLFARDQRTGRTANGTPIPENALFGYFALPELTGTTANPEVFVKVLDGRPVNGRFWVFYGGLTDLEYTVTVRDTVIGATKSYGKAAGSYCGGADTAAFTLSNPQLVEFSEEGSFSFEAEGLRPIESLACTSATLCLLNARFDVSLAARDHRTGKTGAGVPLPENNLFGYFTLPALTGDTRNPEVFVKILDGRAVNGRIWVFYGGLTDLEYTLTVRDNATGATKRYTKGGGSYCGGADTGAF